MRCSPEKSPRPSANVVQAARIATRPWEAPIWQTGAAAWGLSLRPEPSAPQAPAIDHIAGFVANQGPRRRRRRQCPGHSPLLTRCHLALLPAFITLSASMASCTIAAAAAVGACRASRLAAAAPPPPLVPPSIGRLAGCLPWQRQPGRQQLHSSSGSVAAARLVAAAAAEGAIT